MLTNQSQGFIWFEAYNTDWIAALLLGGLEVFPPIPFLSHEKMRCSEANSDGSRQSP